METHETWCDDNGCAGCREAIVRVQNERREGVCATCGERYVPAPFPARVWRPGEPASELRLLARWLPAMDARSPALARVGWSGHNGAGGSAHGGRLDHVDERSVALGRAVAVWQHLRAMIARGDGEAVALLWTAWAFAPGVDDPKRDLRARRGRRPRGRAACAPAGLADAREGGGARSRCRVAAHRRHRARSGRGACAAGGRAPQPRDRVDAGARLPHARAGVGGRGAADAVGARAGAGGAG